MEARGPLLLHLLFYVVLYSVCWWAHGKFEGRSAIIDGWPLLSLLCCNPLPDRRLEVLPLVGQLTGIAGSLACLLMIVGVMGIRLGSTVLSFIRGMWVVASLGAMFLHRDFYRQS